MPYPSSWTNKPYQILCRNNLFFFFCKLYVGTALYIHDGQLYCLGKCNPFSCVPQRGVWSGYYVCFCSTRGFCSREENRSDFPCNLLLRCLVWYIFLGLKEKNELLFLAREDLDFLLEGKRCRIPLSRGNRNLRSAEFSYCTNKSKNLYMVCVCPYSKT